MRYEGDIYSPHIAGDDYVLQCTIGCSHNQCVFCTMYKNKQYRIRELGDILQDITLAQEYYGDLEKVFLADGDALSIPAADLITIVDRLYQNFPGLAYVGTYASADCINKKTLAELIQLREHGLTEVHLGVESGDETVLQAICKGVSRGEMVQAGRKIKQAGIRLLVTVIAGLAGRTPQAWEHARSTADICNAIKPDAIGVLTLMVQAGTVLDEKRQNGEFEIPDDMEIFEEMRLLIRNLDLQHCAITSIHPSNAIHLEGCLPEDQDALLKTLTHIIDARDTSRLRLRQVDKV